VELNRDIVPRNLWVETMLHEGDHLEVVHFVGGGCNAAVPAAVMVAPSPPPVES